MWLRIAIGGRGMAKGGDGRAMIDCTCARQIWKVGSQRGSVAHPCERIAPSNRGIKHLAKHEIQLEIGQMLPIMVNEEVDHLPVER